MSGVSSRWLIGAGLTLLALGLTLRYAPWLISWFGRLPGDIRYEGESSRVYIPLTSMLLVSAVLSLISYLLRR